MRVGPTLRALVTTPLRLVSATGPFLAYGGAVEAFGGRRLCRGGTGTTLEYAP